MLNGAYKTVWSKYNTIDKSCNHEQIDSWLKTADAIGDVLETAHMFMIYAAGYKAFIQLSEPMRWAERCGLRGAS